MLPQPLLQPFNYDGVRLLDGHFQQQVVQAQLFYRNIPDDDILRGFRQQAGLPAPGQAMGGWCAKDTEVVFGQWLSGLARLSRATGDTSLRDKAVRLMTEWGKTGHLACNHYGYDKYVCGLVDLVEYTGEQAALPLLERLTTWAVEHLGRTRLPATDEDTQGGFFNGEIEWYTLPENLYRAYLLTGNATYKTFAEVWHYPQYWDMFVGNSEPAPYGLHAYSHVNTLCSAAMTYAVTGERTYLDIIVNAYDFFQRTQCYATGGYGPGEKLMPPDGALGRSIQVEPNAKYLGETLGRSFETPCGTWAVFKLGRYLLQYTGEARFGDWVEQLLYNGIGAALPMTGQGLTFYYADYRLAGGRKAYFRDSWPCCSGTYLQAVADYHNIIYFKDSDGGLSVNLFVPSQVAWSHDDQQIIVVQRTGYPLSETISLEVQVEHPVTWSLRLRIPSWAENVSIEVNGAVVEAACDPGTWAEVRRMWCAGDTATMRVPLRVRAVPIDTHHPGRAALVYGPLALVRVEENMHLAEPGIFAARAVPIEQQPGAFALRAETTGRYVPFFHIGRDTPYTMYVDLET